MKKIRLAGLTVLILCFMLGLSVFAQTQEKVDNSKSVGTWKLEVTAQGVYYYFIMVIEEAAGKLTGKGSEQSGMFKDIPLSNVSFDGETLTFEVTAPTPTDGIERAWKAAFKIEDDKFEGTLTNNELGTIGATGTREK
jgi:hypothetical protein